MKDLKLYELNSSQEVVMLQCKYTLFKKVVNIVTSISYKKELDFELLNKAYNLVVKRNDSLRIRFTKVKGKTMQYFLNGVDETKVPVHSFNTKEEQEKFIKQITKHAIKYKKGVVIEPYFVHTYDDKYMVVLKVCHLVLDIYGINVVFKDLFGVYEALKNGTELPEPPTSFEESLQKELPRKHNQDMHNRNYEFFKDILDTNEEPYYAGIHGPKNPIWQKQLSKNKRAMKMFFINCDTEGTRCSISPEVTNKVMEYCKSIEQSPANFLFYALSVCTGKLNNNTEKMLPLELYNCRTNYHDKNCAGTKVQSLGCYTKINYQKSFIENFEDFCTNQKRLYRHIGFADSEYEQLLHKTYKSSMLETYYSITYSFIPFEYNDDFYYDMYTNGKGALPAYIAQLYNIATGEIIMAYDCHIKTTSKEDVFSFHKKYVNLLLNIIENPNELIGNIKM